VLGLVEVDVVGEADAEELNRIAPSYSSFHIYAENMNFVSVAGLCLMGGPEPLVGLCALKPSLTTSRHACLCYSLTRASLCV
jgi:hypothetical protein